MEFEGDINFYESYYRVDSNFKLEIIVVVVVVIVLVNIDFFC